MSIDDSILRQEIIDKTQWPYAKREVQYQTIDPSLPGIRDMEHRYKIMNFPKSFNGETVIDIGCNIGMICIDAKRRGASRVVGIDYRPETIEVAKKLAIELELDVEFYVFDVNTGLDNLKSIIGDDQFDHVFALSIWGHVEKPKLADIINFYSSKICWFEGHAAGWTGDTQIKMENDLSSLLNFKYHEYLGETTDRNPRQNFKLSNSYRVVLDQKNDYVYFDGETYEVINKSIYTLPEPGTLSYPPEDFDIQYYSFRGKFCSYVANINSKTGYKIFTADSSSSYLDQDILNKKVTVDRIFKIQNLLHLNNFAPKVHEIITCHDNESFTYAIKMDNIKGKFIDPPKEWKQNLINFCKENGISRKDNSIEGELTSINCIESEGSIYLIDIDPKWDII